MNLMKPYRDALKKMREGKIYYIPALHKTFVQLELRPYRYHHISVSMLTFFLDNGYVNCVQISDPYNRYELTEKGKQEGEQ